MHDLLTFRYEAAISGFKSCVQSYFAPEEEWREPSPSPSNSPKHGSLKRDSGSLAKIALLHKTPDPATIDTNALNFMVKQVNVRILSSFANSSIEVLERNNNRYSLEIFSDLCVKLWLSSLYICQFITLVRQQRQIV